MLFKYDKHNPTPTDKWVIDIHKKFKIAMKEPLDVWKRGVANGLLMERGNVDIVDARITVKKTKFGAVPVITLRPIIDDVSEGLIEKHADFFSVYDKLKDKIFSKIKHNLEMPPELRDSTEVRALINITKLAINLFMMDEFDELDFIAALDNPLSEGVADNLRTLSGGSIVGPKFEEGGLMSDDDPEDLLHAYIRYVRKVLLKEQQDILASLIGNPCHLFQR